MFVDQVIAHKLLVVSAMGAVLPVHVTACGKALLAALPPEEAEAPAAREARSAHATHDHRQGRPA